MRDWYKAFIAYLIVHLVIIIGVLAFVFGVVYITNNMGYLWLLFLLLTTTLLPSFEFNTTTANKQNEANDDPFKEASENETNI